MPRSTVRTLAALAACLFLAPAAQAHHAMGGEVPSTFAHGLISGLAHPVIGLDHLAFVVAAGLVAGVARLGAWTPAAFVLASIGGVLVHLAAVDLPFAEPLIALSVLGAGALLAAARADFDRAASGRAGWLAVFALAGVFHGYAYGESIVGAETTPLGAYLFGLALIQAAIAIGVAALAGHRAWAPTALAPRLAGAAVFGIGLTAVAGQIIPG